MFYSSLNIKGLSFLTVILFLFSFGAIPQNKITIPLKNIGVDQGLSSNTIVDIAQDSLGFVWIATTDGLNRFDGNDFKIYPKLFDYHVDGEYARKGKIKVYGNKLWMITKGGKLEYLDLYTNTFQTINIFSQNRPIPVITDIIFENTQRIWLGTEKNGLFLVNRNFEIVQHFSKSSESSKRLSSNKIKRLFLKNNGNLYIITDEGLNVVENSSIKYQGLKDYNLSAILENHHKDILLGTRGEGFVANRFTDYNFVNMDCFHCSSIPQNLLVEDMLYRVESKNSFEGTIWIATSNKGLIVDDATFDQKMDVEFLRGNFKNEEVHYTKLFLDRENNVWIGTAQAGLLYFNSHFKDLNIINNNKIPDYLSIENIQAITGNDLGQLYIAAGNKIMIYSRQNGYSHFKALELPQELELKRITTLSFSDENHLWIADVAGNLKILDIEKGQIEENYETELKNFNTYINSFQPTDSSNIWAGSSNKGLINFSQDQIQCYKATGNSIENLQSIEKINDSILALGYANLGLKFFNIKTRTFQKAIFPEELKNIVIQDLKIINDILWIGTLGEGLMAYNLRSGVLRKFSTDHGISGNTISGIEAENSRIIWVAGNKGLSKLYYRLEDGTIDIEKIRNFTISNGLQSNAFRMNATYKDNRGFLFFGGYNGLNIINPRKLDDNSKAPQLVFKDLSVNNRSINEDTSVLYRNSVQLKHFQNSIGFKFGSLDFNFPEKTHYKYQLKGIDTAWINSGTRNYASYTNLPPGKYQFQLKFSDQFYHSPEVKKFGIVISKPFWKTGSFYFLISILSLLIIYLIIKFKERHKLEMLRVRDEISSNLHDELGARLTSINLLSAITRRQNEDNNFNQNMAKIDEEIQASSEALDDIVWNFKNTNERLEDILIKIRRACSDIFENENIQYEITLPKFSDKKGMNASKKRGFYFIVKELANNIRKHAKASYVKISISDDIDFLKLMVEDDGVGFNPDETTHRNGLNNIKKRVRNWRGCYSITSNNKGTRIVVKIPYDKKYYWMNF